MSSDNTQAESLLIHVRNHDDYDWWTLLEFGCKPPLILVAKPIVSLFMLVHNYTLCFIGSSGYNVSYYNYNSTC